MEGDGAQSSHNPIKCVGLGWAATQLSLVGLVWALTEPTSYFFYFFLLYYHRVSSFLINLGLYNVFIPITWYNDYGFLFIMI